MNKRNKGELPGCGRRAKPAPDPNLDPSEYEFRTHTSQLSEFYRMDPDMRRMDRLAQTSPWAAAAKKAQERERRTGRGKR